MRIYLFNANYKYNEQWGCESDWREYLCLGSDVNKNPICEHIINFIKWLINSGILIPNKIIKRNEKKYQAYKLVKDFKKRIEKEIIELDPYFIFLESKVYEITTE